MSVLIKGGTGVAEAGAQERGVGGGSPVSVTRRPRLPAEAEAWGCRRTLSP